MKEIGLGIIGFGGIGEYHTRIIKNIENIRVAGVYDIMGDRMEAAKIKGFPLFDSMEQLIASDDVDLVLIATPNDVHFPIAKQCMESGKNIMLEKPATMNAADFETLMAIAEQYGVLLTVHQNRRWDADYLAVKAMYDSGDLGQVFSIESRVQSANGIPSGWRTLKQNGGGMLLDWGVHLIDQLVQMIPAGITAVNCRFNMLEQQEVDEGLVLTLSFANGVTAIVDIQTRFFIPLPRWLISGTMGAGLVENWQRDGKQILANDEGIYFEPEIVYTAAGPTKTMAPRRKETVDEKPLPNVKSTGRELYQNLIGVLNDEAELIVKPQEVLRVLKIIDAAFQSAESTQTMKFDCL